MTGTLAYVFVALAIICIVAGVTAVSRTRRAGREDAEVYGGDDDEATYAEEAAAVRAAQEAAAKAEAAPEPEGPLQ